MTDEDKAPIEYFHMGPWPVFVGFTMSEVDFQAEIKRLNVNEEVSFLGTVHANATTHFFERKGGLVVIITLADPKRRSKEQVAGLVAYEAMHAVQEIWRHLGERQAGPEAEAYLIQYITQSILEIVWNTGSKRKVVP